MKYIKLLFLSLIFSGSLIYSQETNGKSGFISLNTGTFISSIDQFSKTYDSRFGFIYGIEVAIANTEQTYFFIKVSYFAKNGTPVTNDFDYSSGYPIFVKVNKEGSAKFTQLLMNEGFIYNLFLDSDWTLGLNGGITFCLVSKEEKNARGDTYYSTDASGMFGVFIGAALEKKFNDSHVSVFLEPQYNYVKSNVLIINSTTNNVYIGNYGGLNLSAGIRFYFKEIKLH